MSAIQVFTLVLATRLLLVVNLLDVPPDGACFFHCLVAGLSLLLRTTRIDRRIPNDSGQLRLYLCSNLLELANIKIPGLELSPLKYFDMEYSRNAEPRQCLHNSNYNAFVAQTGGDPNKTPLFVDTFREYLEWMKNPSTQVDGLIVAFAAAFLGLDLTVYTQALTEVQEDSHIPEVKQLISMGFKKSIVEEVLTQTQRNVDAAIEILLQMDSTKSEEKQRVWYEQRYCWHSNAIKISMIQDGYHFKLILPDEEQQSVQPEESQKLSELMSYGFSREKTEQALIQANGEMQAAVEKLLSLPRVVLPDVPEELLNSPESASSCVFSREQLYSIFNCELQRSSPRLPQNLLVEVRIQRCADPHFLRSLFDGFIFPELGDVKYRIVCFTFEDESNIVWSKNVEDLSHGAEKKHFFSQFWGKIAIQSVTRVVIEKC
jgi:hypothetical protein